jgi:hypothetical protein
MDVARSELAELHSSHIDLLTMKEKIIAELQTYACNYHN